MVFGHVTPRLYSTRREVAGSAAIYFNPLDPDDLGRATELCLEERTGLEVRKRRARPGGQVLPGQGRGPAPRRLRTGLVDPRNPKDVAPSMENHVLFEGVAILCSRDSAGGPRRASSGFGGVRQMVPTL
jgi:hypothetical protein